MNINKACKIELTASTDRTRIAINEPYLHIEDGNGTLVATDGRRCVVIPVELGEKDVAGFVSEEVLKAARKQTKPDGVCSVELNDCAVLPNGATLPREGAADKASNYPNWKQVVPREDYPHKIAFNAKFLYECAQAMGAETVSFHFKDAISPIVLTPCSTGAVQGARAILMPVRIT